LEPDNPKWIDNNIVKNHDHQGSFKVVSFNIEHAVKIEQAIKELRTIPELQNAAILLLQEMDEKGTQLIAEQLGYNYVYFPGSFNPKKSKNFGNAILSKWPMTAIEKILLPHAKKSNDRRRIAVAATIVINEKKVRLYSVHLETILLKKSKRIAQSAFLVDQIQKDDSDYIIVGGDFNTVFKGYRKTIIQQYQSIGLKWASQEIGSTGSEFLGIIKPVNDHFFTKGFKVINSEKYEQTSASDHYPITIEMVFE